MEFTKTFKIVSEGIGVMSKRVKINIGLSILVSLLAYTSIGEFIFPSFSAFFVTIGILVMVTVYSSIIALLQKENHWISIITLFIGISPFIYLLFVVVTFIMNPGP